MSLLVIFVLVLLALGILVLGPCLLVVTIAWARRGSKAGGTPDEARVIQEIHQGLSRLEERVESLETILVETERQRQHEHAQDGERA